MKGNISFLYGWRTRIGNHSEIDEFVEFKCPTSHSNDATYNIVLDEHVFIGRGTVIDSNTSVRIGKNSFVAPFCFIIDTNHKYSNPSVTISLQGCLYGPIEIEEDVWIGAHTVILPGVKIGRGSIIAANSTVTKNIEPYVVASGSPARIIKRRD